MTEQEWLQCTDPKPMLDYLQRTGNAISRKLRLLSVGAWYRYKRLSESAVDWAATEAAEQTAETMNRFSVREMKRTRQELNFAVASIAGRSLSARKAERAAQAGLVRCVFGNPFHPTLTCNPTWLRWNAGTVVRLAEDIYQDRAFDRLPILADALEDAGCDNADILNHLRQPEEHVRGCWVLDLVRSVD
jgi:hypothetical protein